MSGRRNEKATKAKNKERRKKNLQAKSKKTVEKTEVAVFSPKDKKPAKLLPAKKIKRKESKEKQKREKKSKKALWLEGFLFFLLFISLGLIFTLGGEIFGSPEKQIWPTGQIHPPQPPVIEGSLTEESQQIIEREEDAQLPEIDSTDWKNYSNSWYGFAIKYPPSWPTPVAVNPTPINRKVGSTAVAATENWEKKYFFARPAGDTPKNIVGFDLFVYDIKKVSELRNTAEFPLVKKTFSENPVSCNLNIGNHLIERADSTAEEIYVPLGDKCLENTFFFSLTSERYIFNLAPRFKDDFTTEKNLRNETISDLPEFFGSAINFELIDIKRPAPKPKITAPMPAAYAMVGGRMVCNKKNDKPSRSDKTKHRHLDMECCLDPDEYPNPHCYYDPAKYGKYLK